MKTLYLDGRAGMQVKLDGPALRTRKPGRADGQYPLARVSRVVAIGAVSWHSEALNACLREQRPVAILDRRGRFVRILFRSPERQNGLARHLGSLLDVPRFKVRYSEWLETTERREINTFFEELGSQEPRGQRPGRIWPLVPQDQYRRWGVRTGAAYRYLMGLASAQIASAFALIGMPRDPGFWSRGEYLLFSDWLRLERWNLAALLERMLAGSDDSPNWRGLTTFFESGSEEREVRIAAWRSQALLAMMGIRDSTDGRAAHDAALEEENAHKATTIVRLCLSTQSGTTNLGRVAFGTPESFRSSIRILRCYLEADRRAHESYRGS